ncbi:Putative DNA-binding domain-containing protein [Rhizobiales bacterium GAS188]|nr:Putative DNA-binding domain-containing protein [Rhizobiales bacterium GAS188]
MSTDIQSRFAAALLDSGRAVPSGLTSWSGALPVRHFAIYRNNVVTGLVRALAARFPATSKIVGEEFFAAMAQAFIERHPPRSPMLLAYGEGFADFVENFEPAAELVYLPDVIRLEAARARAYHASDKEPLEPGELAKVQPERLGELIIELQPSAAILRSRHPVITIWAMNSGEAELGPIDDWRGEDALVVRPQQLVTVRRLPSGGAAFLQSLGAGMPLSRAVETATAETADFDLAANLAGILDAGVVVGLHLSA